MFLLWFVVGCVVASSEVVTQLRCTDTATDVCSGEKSCRVSCEESCELFVENQESVSVCGWLQSQGYDTTDLLAQPLKYNLNIQSIASKRSKRSAAVSSHVFPYTPFKFIREPQPKTKTIGSRIEFFCDAQGNSSLKYHWYRTLVTSFTQTPWIPQKIEGASGKEYVIPETKSTDNGYYMCVVTEEGISGNVYWSTPVKLELQYLQSRTVSIEELTQQSGKSLLKVKCELPASNPPAIATWYKYNAEDVPERIFGIEDKYYDPKTGFLYLLNLDRSSHAGIYECRANNTGLNEHVVVKRVELTITGESIPNQTPPTKAFFDETAARTATVGSKVVLRCAAYGFPIPKVYWTFGDAKDTLCKIPSSRYTSYDEGREIEIHAVKQQDADYFYECHAESGNNPVVEIGSLSHVGIYRRLEITQEKREYFPKLGQNITLSCPGTGQFRKFWYKNGDRLRQDSGDYYEKNNTANSLLISPSTQTRGVYTCLSLGEHGGMVLLNLHMTMPVQELTVHIASDISDDVMSNDVEAPIRNNTFVTCTASGYPPPRLYWYENSNLVTDSSRYSFSFNKSNVTVINTTLNVSRSEDERRKTLNITCIAVVQTEGYVQEKSAVLVLYSEGDTGRVESVENKQTIYIIAGASCFVVLLLVALTVVLGVKFKKERMNTKPIRTYIKDIQSIQRDGGGEVSTKGELREEWKYAVYLHDILKTMNLKDEGDMESFRDIIGDWVNEDLQGNDDSDFARRFRDSFISKRSVGNRLNSSNRFGNQFKLDMRADRKGSVEESNVLDETPERDSYIPLGRRSPRDRRASNNPVYAALPEDDADGETEIDTSLRHTAL
ncbi:hypothetical protein ACHWQZ_G000849 [Mnemiopsis leidyi]